MSEDQGAKDRVILAVAFLAHLQYDIAMDCLHLVRFSSFWAMRADGLGLARPIARLAFMRPTSLCYAGLV